MPTKKEVLDLLVEMQNDLMFTGSNLLGMDATMKVWDDLSNSVKNREKGQLESKFIHFESVIFRDYKLSPSKLIQTRRKYASGKATILSTTEKNSTEDVPKKQGYKTTRASPVSSPSTNSGLYHDNDDAKLRLLQQKHDDMENQLRATVSELRKAERHRDDLLERKQMDPLQKQYEEMEKQLKDTQAKLRQSETDKEYWVDRMSKLTGDKLTQDNPDISDLSDPKRPHKLGEKYSQLYDDEWTDAMEKLTDTNGTETSERQGIDILIDILRKTHESCTKLADDQMKQLEDALILESRTEKSGMKNCPIEAKRSLKDAQKQASLHSLPMAQKIVRKKLASLEKEYGVIPLDKLSSFVDKCTEICWSMVMQSPRMEFLYPEQSQGKTFDKDNFKEFTRSGDLLDYLVWPAMVIQKQGSLLVKGTVQPVAPGPRKS